MLGKEVAPFNIRTLTVILGTFNTNFRSGDSQSKVPVPNAYEGTRTDSVMKAIVSRSLKPNGDKDKAMKAVYDVIVGQGPGERKDSEPLLVLGNDMISRVYIAKSHFQAGLDAFGDLASSVKLE